MTRLAQVVIRLRHGLVPNPDDGQHAARVVTARRACTAVDVVATAEAPTSSPAERRTSEKMRATSSPELVRSRPVDGGSTVRSRAETRRSAARAVGETRRVASSLARPGAPGVRVDHVGGIGVRRARASRLFASHGAGSCRFTSRRSHGDASNDAGGDAIRPRADLEGHLSAVGEACDVGRSDGRSRAGAGGAEQLVHHSGDVLGADGAGGDAHAGGLETTGEGTLG